MLSLPRLKMPGTGAPSVIAVNHSWGVIKLRNKSRHDTRRPLADRPNDLPESLVRVCITNRPAAYNRGNHEVRLHHSLAGCSCSVSARGFGAQPGAGIVGCIPCCATERSASARAGSTTLAVSAGSFLSAKDKRHSCIGHHAGPEWGDHDGFGSNGAIAEPGGKERSLQYASTDG